MESRAGAAVYELAIWRSLESRSPGSSAPRYKLATRLRGFDTVEEKEEGAGRGIACSSSLLKRCAKYRRTVTISYRLPADTVDDRTIIVARSKSVRSFPSTKLRSYPAPSRCVSVASQDLTMHSNIFNSHREIFYVERAKEQKKERRSRRDWRERQARKRRCQRREKMLTRRDDNARAGEGRVGGERAIS